MLRSVKFALAVFGALSIGVTAASAAPLVGTGNPPTGIFGETESNWEVTPTGFPFGNLLHIVSGPADYAPGTWVDAIASGLTGKWITPYSNEASLPGSEGPNPLPAGGPNTLAVDDPNAHDKSVDYTYTLSDFNKPAGPITIKWSSDNGAKFYLNNSLALSTILDTGYGSLTAFSILLDNTFWKDTGNVFTVVVQNLEYTGSNPTGLLVDISTVPLPPALLLFGSGLLGMNWLRRRRTAPTIAARL